VAPERVDDRMTPDHVDVVCERVCVHL
jgi:hypothetical protein